VTWPLARLVDIAPITKESPQPWSGFKRYIATGDVDNNGNAGGTHIDYASRPTRADLIARPGDVIFARMANTSKVFQVSTSDSENVYSTGFAIVRPDRDNFHSGYLVHWLRSGTTQEVKNKLSTGATQRALTDAGLRTLMIPLPPLDEQQRISSILDEADTIRTNRREQLHELDELGRALFFDEFGNPLLSSRFKRLPISQLAKVVTGNTPSRSQPSNYGEGIDWVKSDNLGAKYITDTDEQLTEIGKRKSRVAPIGSVLVCCIAGSRSSIGRASIADKEVAFNQQINAILPSAALDPIFLYSQLLVAPELVRRKSTGGMKGLVSKSAFTSIEVLVPPKHAQETFSSKAAEIHAERDRVERALEADEELFAALQHRAFRGEL